MNVCSVMQLVNWFFHSVAKRKTSTCLHCQYSAMLALSIPLFDGVLPFNCTKCMLKGFMCDQGTACAAVSCTVYGLDPLLQSYLKLFVEDIHSLSEDSTHPGVFFYKDHPVLKVDIVGNVVGIQVRHNFSLYSVDDGTGVVSCLQWKQMTDEGCHRKQLQLDILADRFTECFTARISKMKKQITNVACQLGDLVHVRGKIKSFFGQVQINIHNLRHISDPMEEVSHMLRQLELYKHVYDKPAHLPDNVRLQLLQPHTNSLVRLVKQLKLVIHDELSQSQHATVTRSQLLECDKVNSLITTVTDCDRWQHLLEQALDQLVEDGFLLKDHNSSHYMIISNSQQLAASVLDILRSNQNSSGHGYHVLHILRELHKNAHFIHLNINHMTYLLTAMESNSDIISTTDKHYIALC